MFTEINVDRNISFTNDISKALYSLPLIFTSSKIKLWRAEADKAACPAWKEKGLINVYKQVVGQVKKMVPGSSLAMSNRRPRGHGPKLKYNKFHLNIRMKVLM